MIAVPVPTVEKPLTVIDFIAGLYQCASITEVQAYSDQVPPAYREDERYARAVAQQLAAIKEREAA